MAGRNFTWRDCLARMETLPGLITAQRLSLDLGVDVRKARNLIIFAREVKAIKRVAWGQYQWVPATERPTVCD
jgi:hypothetical protein